MVPKTKKSKTKKSKTNTSASAEETMAATTSKQEEEKKFDGFGYEQSLVKRTESYRKSPRVRFEELADATEAKIVLESIIRPRNWPDILKGIYRPWSKFMFVGPPGNGTSMLANAVATECKTSLFVLYSFSLESEKHVRLLFEMASFYAPSTILIKRLECLNPQRGTDSEQEARRRAESELISQMEGIRSNDDPCKRVVVLVSTHYPWNIDSALLRQMGKIINIPLPNATGRLALLKMILRNVELAPDVDLKEISRFVEGHNSEDIIRICRSACSKGLNRRCKGLTSDEIRALNWEGWEPPPVTAEDFLVAIGNTPKWTKKEDLEKFEKWRDEFFDLQ